MRHTIGGLDSLLRALRTAGIAVGELETTRLRTAFAGEPILREDQIATLLRCTLVKQPEQADTFDRLYRAWVADADGELRAPVAPRLDDEPFAPTSPPRRRGLRLPWLGLIALGVLAAGIVLWFWLREPARPTEPLPPDPKPAAQQPVIVPPLAGDLPSEPVTAYKRWQVELDRTLSLMQPSPSPRRWLLLIPILLAMATALAVWRLHLRPRLTGAAPAIRSGPTDEPLLVPPQPDRSLLSADDARLVVAGVDSFVAEQPSHELDLPRTVHATAAAGGIPTLVSLRQRLPREIWLWRDHTCSSPTAHLLVADFATALQRAGHTVRVAAWHGDLETITWQQGERITPLALEAHRQQALVGVFTDGEGLRLRYESATEAPALRQLLTALARWPHLAFIDCANPSLGLPWLADKFGIPCLTAAEAPAFVGLQRRAVDAAAEPLPLHFELGDWAQAMALWPGMFREADALDAHLRLGLGLPRHQLQSLLAHARPLGLGYEFDAESRSQLLHRLATTASAVAETDGQGEPDLLRRACSYWLDRFTAEDALRTEQQTAMAPWSDTEAQARLQMERALVRLWVEPDEAAIELHALSRRRRIDAPADAAPALSDSIAQRLANYRADANADSLADDGRRHIALPWRWQARPVPTQLRLWQLGFGRGALRLAMRIRPSRQSLLALGVCLGVASAMVGAWLMPGPTVQSSEPAQFGAPAPSPGLVQRFVRMSDLATAIVGEPTDLMVISGIPHGARLVLRWREVDATGQVAVWDRGSKSNLVRRPQDWPDLSVAVLRAEPSEPDARQLAIHLLDTGTVDRVVFSKEQALSEMMRVDHRLWTQWFVFTRSTPTAADRPDAAGAAGEGARSVVVTQPDFAVLARALNRDAFATEVWPGLCEVTSRMPRVRGGVLAAIPAGSFLMGSAADDGQADFNERPQHQVTVGAFLLWRTELTRAEYRAVMPEAAVPAEWTETEDDRLPANYVDFDAAVRCCNSLSRRDGLPEYYELLGSDVRVLGGVGYRLPSEAEWEYACRAGMAPRYSARDDEADLALVGWYIGNSDGRVHAVAKKPASAFGLHDMHGNVFELCEDEWHDSYQGAPTDGSAWVGSAPAIRVSRGGCFVNSAGYARSAFRYRAPPAWRYAWLGFRPARSVGSN